MKVEATTDLPAIESRMLRWMAALGALGTAAILATGRLQVGMAFAVGAGLGMLNFHWLWQTGKVLMEAQAAQAPRKTVILMVARYPLALAGLAILYIGGWLHLLPLIAGLLIPGAGVLVESLFLIGAGLRHNQAASL
jgi:hypothetical protein